MIDKVVYSVFYSGTEGNKSWVLGFEEFTTVGCHAATDGLYEAWERSLKDAG